MPESYLEQIEQQELFRKKQNNSVSHIFRTDGSTGNNNQELAQILTAFDNIINILGWSNKPLAKFSQYITNYQASIDGIYHKDFKDISIAEEIERRRSERKGISILQQ